MTWTETELTPHPAFYHSDTGETLYVHDGHRGRLHRTGDRYRLVYVDGDVPFDSTVVDTTDADDPEAALNALQDSIDAILEHGYDPS